MKCFRKRRRKINKKKNKKKIIQHASLQASGNNIFPCISFNGKTHYQLCLAAVHMRATSTKYLIYDKNRRKKQQQQQLNAQYNDFTKKQNQESLK